MEFLNIGGGELVVIALLALILFGPEDLAKMMRKIGQFARRTQQMWRQLSSTVQEELEVSELQEAVAEVKATTAEVQETLNKVGASVREISADLEQNVNEAQRELKVQADESAAALRTSVTEQVPTSQAEEAVSELEDVVTEAHDALAHTLDVENPSGPTNNPVSRESAAAQLPLDTSSQKSDSMGPISSKDERDSATDSIDSG